MHYTFIIKNKRTLPSTNGALPFTTLHVHRQSTASMSIISILREINDYTKQALTVSLLHALENGQNNLGDQKSSHNEAFYIGALQHSNRCCNYTLHSSDEYGYPSNISCIICVHNVGTKIPAHHVTVCVGVCYFLY